MNGPRLWFAIALMLGTIGFGVLYSVHYSAHMGAPIMQFPDLSARWSRP